MAAWASCFKGFDRELKRCVAIKVLSPHLAASSLARKRFAREAQAAAAVVHPNVLAIHQVQPAGRLPFLVMPLVAGESLAQRLTAQGRLELKEVLRIGMQAAAGLSAAHEQGLVHRDVKPANILLEKGVERAVLTDFGLARAADDVSMTRWGIIAGTPQYMSPEQARGEPLDGRSDLFSLGCVLYEMATGVSPFRADSTLATLRRLIDDPPPAMASLNPELPPWFIGIVERLLEKDPARRFASAKEVSELLEGCLAHLQQPASVPLPAVMIEERKMKERKIRRRTNDPSSSSESSFVTFSFLTFLRFKGVIAMIATLGIALLGMLGMQATEPPDIAGQWTGEGWGRVVLTQTAPGQYTGTYTDTVAKEKEPGKIESEMVADRASLQRHLERGRGPFRRPFHSSGGPGDSRRTDDRCEVEDQSRHAAAGGCDLDTGRTVYGCRSGQAKKTARFGRHPKGPLPTERHASGKGGRGDRSIGRGGSDLCRTDRFPADRRMRRRTDRNPGLAGRELHVRGVEDRSRYEFVRARSRQQGGRDWLDAGRRKETTGWAGDHDLR